MPFLPAQPSTLIIRAIWLVLALEAVTSLATGRWAATFVAIATLVATLLPYTFASRFGLRLPTGYAAAITVFIFATLFLGEVLDFYNRFWWWDLVLHGGAAMGFGLFGTLLVLMLFEGDRYAAPPLAIAFISFCFAIAIGAIWEVFEFSMDQLFGFNMQKSGLFDTMSDLIVDMVGATLGAATGYFYLIGQRLGGLTGILQTFVRANQRLYQKAIRRRPGR